jgi:hypothetical protein
LGFDGADMTTLKPSFSITDCSFTLPTILSFVNATTQLLMIAFLRCLMLNDSSRSTLHLSLSRQPPPTGGVAAAAEFPADVDDSATVFPAAASLPSGGLDCCRLLHSVEVPI